MERGVEEGREEDDNEKDEREVGTDRGRKTYLRDPAVAKDCSMLQYIIAEGLVKREDGDAREGGQKGDLAGQGEGKEGREYLGDAEIDNELDVINGQGGFGDVGGDDDLGSSGRGLEDFVLRAAGKERETMKEVEK